MDEPEFVQECVEFDEVRYTDRYWKSVFTCCKQDQAKEGIPMNTVSVHPNFLSAEEYNSLVQSVDEYLIAHPDTEPKALDTSEII